MSTFSDSILTEVKLALRITSTAYDDEIETIIDAAADDLLMSGLASSALAAATPDPLVKRAVVLYAKAEFGQDNPDAEKYMASYRQVVSRLVMSAEYQQPKYTGLTGSITAGSDDLTMSAATLIAEDDWLSVAGAGAGGALLIARATAIVGNVVTLSRVAGTTVAAAAVTLL